MTERSVSRWALTATLGLILLGTGLRIAQFAHNRALWLDEAALALQVLYKTPVELLGPLGWHQNSPLAFLLSVKAITVAFGTSDWALRALPILSGVVSVLLFAILARMIARPKDDAPLHPWTFGSMDRERWDIALVALALFAVSKHLLYYSSELRHYSTDVMLVCALYILTLWARDRRGRVMLLGVAGVIATWFSLASIFVLGAIGATRVLFSLARRDWKRFAWGAGLSAVWLASFLIHLRIQSHNIAVRGLGPEIALHNSMSFMPMPPTSFADLKWFRETFDMMFYIPVGLTYRGLGGFAFLAGCITLWRQNRERAALLMLPFAFALFASGLERYPFRDRYILFLAPCLILLIAAGVGFLLDRKRLGTRLVGLVLFAMLFAQPLVHGLKVIAQPRGGYEIKPLLAHMQERWHEGDGVYVPLTAVPPFMLYAPRMAFAPVAIPAHLYDQTGLDFVGLTEGQVVLEPHRGEFLDEDEGFLKDFQDRELSALLARSHSVWILFEHDAPLPIHTLVGEIDDIGRLLETTLSDGASLYRYQSVDE